MNAAQLQCELAERGCQLWAEGEMLRFRAPDGALTPELMKELKRQKKAMLELLREGSGGANKPSRSHAVSFGQQALWLLHQSDPQSPAYNVCSAARIESAVDFDALARVWRTLLSRHEALRTTFESAAGQLAARVHESPPLDIEQVDAAGWPADRVHARVKRDYERPFDLGRGPLARLRLYKIAPEEHVLLVAMHHIVFDAWSLWILLEELGSLYEKEAAGEAGTLPAPAARYADFVRWQQEQPNSESGRRQWEYWQQRLRGPAPCAALPCDRARRPHAARRGASHHFRLPEELAAGLRALGKSAGATPFMTLLAVFQALLHLHSGQTDFVVGTTTSGRAKKEFSRLVGYFVNALPLRAEVDPEASFADLLEQSRERTVEAIAAQDFPFPLLVERLNPQREPGALPLCRTVFGLQKPNEFSRVMEALDDAERAIDWGGLRARAYPLDQQEGQFDLTLEMYETATTFLGVLKYDTQLFDDPTARRLAERYVHLAQQLVEDPRRPLRSLSLVGDAERAELARLGAAPEATPLAAETLAELFERQAAATPDCEAITCEGETLTYDGLNRHANQLAWRLAGLGVGVGDAVGCCLERGVDAHVAQVACVKLGAAYVPIDEAGPRDRLGRILADCEASVLLTHESVATRLGLKTEGATSPRVVLLDHSRERLDTAPTANPAAPVSGETTAYVIYTSGTTGAPKGVVVSHAAFCRHVARAVAAFEIGPNDHVLQFSAMTFDPSLEQAWTAWSQGAKLVARGPRLWSASEFWSVVTSERVTVANVPPAYFREVSDALARRDGAETLRLMIVGGDALPVAALGAWRGSGVRLLNAYGPTEAVVTATVWDIDERIGEDGRAPIGRPLAGTATLIVDDDGRERPLGVAGELLISGPLADGYLHDAALTRARFVERDGARYYRTGDVARWNNEGQLEFIGRRDRQVKLRGYRVELGEVESALASLDGVREAAARVVTDDSGEPALVAYYTAEPNSTLDPSSLMAALRARLPHYMTPERWALLDELPLGASGKIDEARLRAETGEPADATRGYAPPETRVQEVLCSVWSTVLGVERVGIHDDFFDLGGASLKSLKIVSLAEERGLRLADQSFSPALLFEYPTVAELAQHLVLGDALEPAGAATA